MNDFDKTIHTQADFALSTEQANNSPAAFDYSIFSDDDRNYLQGYRSRKTKRQQTYYLDEAADLAEIQSRCAKHGTGVFNKWIETETDNSIRTVYNLIDVHNRFCKFAETEQKKFLTLPKMLQYDISAKSAPPELVEQVMNGSITTHKEYIEKKNQLDGTDSGEKFDYSILSEADRVAVKQAVAAMEQRKMKLIIDINKDKAEAFEILKSCNRLDLYKPWCQSLGIDWAGYEPTEEEFERFTEVSIAELEKDLQRVRANS